MKYTPKDFYNLTDSPARFNPVQKIRKAVLFVQFFVGCLAVIRDPRKTDSVLRTAQGIVTPERFAYTLNHLKSLPGGKELFETKERMPLMDVQTLSHYPVGSLGFAYAEHMKKNNLDPDFYDVEFSDDITYAFYRYGKIHDLLHLLTRFDTSVAGEMGVLGYSYAQNRGPGLILATSLTFLHGVFYQPRDLYCYIQNFVDGWQIGQSTRPFFTHDWHDALEKPLVEVCADLGIGGTRFLERRRVARAENEVLKT